MGTSPMPEATATAAVDVSLQASRPAAAAPARACCVVLFFFARLFLIVCICCSRIGEPVDVQALMDRLRVHAVRRRVRAVEFLRDYDRLHSGIIPKSKFLSGLIAATFELNAAEQEALAAAYAVDSDRVNYTQFCDDIESGTSCRLVLSVSHQPHAQLLFKRIWRRHPRWRLALWTSTKRSRWE